MLILMCSDRHTDRQTVIDRMTLDKPILTYDDNRGMFVQICLLIDSNVLVCREFMVYGDT